MINLSKAGVIVGALGLVGSAFLVSHPMKITTPIVQGPPREIAIVWQSSYGQLGVLAFVVAGLLFFGSLPKTVRLTVLGAFLALSAIGLDAGFHFNDYHAWWWHTYWFVFPWGVASAVAGVYLMASTLTERRKLLLWVVLPAFAAAVALTIGLLVANIANLDSLGFGYYCYDDLVHYPYGIYNSCNGDWLVYFYITAAFQVFVGLGLFAGFYFGLILNRFGSALKYRLNGKPDIQV